jgi:hypothetical protein
MHKVVDEAGGNFDKPDPPSLRATKISPVDLFQLACWVDRLDQLRDNSSDRNLKHAFQILNLHLSHNVCSSVGCPRAISGQGGRKLDTVGVVYFNIAILSVRYVAVPLL